MSTESAADRRLAWTTSAFVAAGIALRLRQYLFNRSLWFDETLLSLNILGRDTSGLLRPLDNHQAAPIGFLGLEKLAVHIFGTSEYALRLVPLLAGIASLYLFDRLLRLCVPPLAGLIASGLFALSTIQIDYSTEVKQYSSDVAIALVLLLAALSFHRTTAPSRWQLVWLAVLGAAAVWFSHPAVFILAGAGTGLGWYAVRDRNWRRVVVFGLVAATWATSWAICYVVALRAAREDTFLSGEWSQAFVPWSSGPYWIVSWTVEQLPGLFGELVGIVLPGLGLFAFVVGVAIWRADETKRQLLLIIIAPAAFVLLAVGLHAYPLEKRFLLFLTPSLLLFIALGVNQVWLSTRRQAPVIGVTLVALLLFHPVWNAIYAMKRPHTKEEIRSVLDYVKQHTSSDDALYLYWRTDPGFEYYLARTGRDPRLEKGRTPRRNWSSPSGSAVGYMDTFGLLHGAGRTGQFIQDIAGLRGKARVWFVFTRVANDNGLDEEQWFLQYLSRIGTRLDAFNQPGASAYLFALSPPQP